MSVAASAAEAAQWAADALCEACHGAIAARGRALVAVSGGTTPGAMLREFATRDLPWESIFVAQVDERCVPRDDPRRNLAALEQALVLGGRLPSVNLLAVPVEASNDARHVARRYEQALQALAGQPVVFDVVQLGLGEDGHTASLVPGDPVLEVLDADVAATRPYQGTVRVTLTRPVLDRARRRLWLVTGAGKAAALADLAGCRGGAPATLVSRAATTAVADHEAAVNLAEDRS